MTFVYLKVDGDRYYLDKKPEKGVNILSTTTDFDGDQKELTWRDAYDMLVRAENNGFISGGDKLIANRERLEELLGLPKRKIVTEDDY